MSSFLNPESSFIAPSFVGSDSFEQLLRDSMGNPLRDSIGNPLRRGPIASEAAQVLRDTDQSIHRSVAESEQIIADEGSVVEQAGVDATEVKLRVAIMRVLTPVLAVGDLIKNGVAIPAQGFTATAVTDSVADLTLVGNQIRAYCTRGEVVGYGFGYMLIALVQVLESLNGLGRPDTGQAFADGAAGFDSLGATLAGAEVDPSRWSGPAADGYARLNGELESLAAQLTELDRAMAALLQGQADDIEKVRIGFTSVKATFAALMAIMPALIAMSRHKATLLLALRIMAGLTIGGLVSALGLLVFAVQAGWRHANSAQGIINAYETAASFALDRAAGPTSAPVPVSSAAPGASAAGPARASGPAPAPQPAPASSGAAPAARAATAADPTPAPAPTPKPSLPTLGQIAETVGIASQVEAGLAQAATQGMQSVQQFTALASQAGRHAPTAPAAPVLAAAVADGDGNEVQDPPAEAGAAGAGRAPVDAGRPPRADQADQRDRLV